MPSYYSIALLILFVAQGCNFPQTEPAPHVSDNMPTIQDFDAATKGTSYTISEGKKNNILHNYSSLVIGMNKKEVAALLGDPNYSYTIQSKESKYLGSSWAYYFFRPKPALGTVAPESNIILYFNEKDMLTWVVPHNIEELKKIGGSN